MCSVMPLIVYIDRVLSDEYKMYSHENKKYNKKFNRDG